MAYRIFISTTTDEKTSEYINTIKQALWHLEDFPVAPMTIEDLALAEENPETLIRQTLDEIDIFIGIYGSSFGEYKHLNVADLIEYEYMYATERGLNPIIFMPNDYDITDERLKRFKETIQARHIIHTFDSAEDLKAKLVVAITNFRLHARKRPNLPKPPSGLLGQQQETSLPTSTSDGFESDVRRAFDLIEDDMEALIQRVLSVQEARNIIQPPPLKGAGHQMQVNPIFGQPNQNVQFQSDIFMIMPFRDEYNSIYKNVIVPSVNSLNLTIKRGDEFSSVNGQIMSEVWAAINACRLVIVETSVENANVYYELGIAHTLGKPAILITQGKEIEDFPFDIRHLRFIVYENTIAGGEKLEADLKQSIIWIINDLEDGL